MNGGLTRRFLLIRRWIILRVQDSVEGNDDELGGERTLFLSFIRAGQTVRCLNAMLEDCGRGFLTLTVLASIKDIFSYSR